MNRIIDVTMFFNEDEMYRARLEYLSDVVEEFVVLEGDRSHSDVPRPVSFPLDLMDMVTHIHVPLPQGGSNWPRVEQHRNAQSSLYRSQEDRDYYKDALFLFSDLDEFPNVDLLREIRDGETVRAKEWVRRLKAGQIGVFCGEMYYYNPLTLAQYWWQGCRMATLPMLLRYTPHQLRHDPARLGLTEFRLPKEFNEMPCLSNPECEEEEVGCVHCTYFGDENFVSHKMQSVAESTGYVTEEMADPQRLKSIMEQGLDPYGRKEHIYYKLEKPRKSMPEVILRRFLK